VKTSAGFVVEVIDAITSGIAPTPDPAEKQTVLEHLELPDKLIAQLDPLLMEAGFTLDHALRRLKDRQLQLKTYHHQVEVTMQGQDDGYIFVALLHLSKKLQEDYFDSCKFEVAQRIRTFDLTRKVVGVIVFCEASSSDDKVVRQLNYCLDDLVKDEHLRCVWTEDVDDLAEENPGRRIDMLREWMGGNKGVLPKAARRSPQTVEDLQNSDERKSIEEEIVKIMVGMAKNYDPGPTKWLQSCIMGTDWPTEWKVRRTGDAAILGDTYDDAERLVGFAIDQGTLAERDDDLTYMGSLLSSILRKFKPGKEQTQTFERIIVKYDLIKNYKPTT